MFSMCTDVGEVMKLKYSRLNTSYTSKSSSAFYKPFAESPAQMVRVSSYILMLTEVG